MPEITPGPFETEREARDAAQHIYSLPPGTGAWTSASLAMLMDACANAGISLGAYDSRILHWLAGWEPSTVAVLAGLLTRASERGKGWRKELTDSEQFQVDEARDILARWDDARGTPCRHDTERVLADHLRAVLALIPGEVADA